MKFLKVSVLALSLASSSALAQGSQIDEQPSKAQVADLNQIHTEYMQLLSEALKVIAQRNFSQSLQKRVDYLFIKRGLLSLYPSPSQLEEVSDSDDFFNLQKSEYISIVESSKKTAMSVYKVRARKNFVFKHLRSIAEGNIVLPYELFSFKYENCSSYMDDFRFTLIKMHQVLNPLTTNPFHFQDINRWLESSGVEVTLAFEDFYNQKPEFRCKKKRFYNLKQKENVIYSPDSNSIVLYQGKDSYPSDTDIAQFLKNKFN